MDTVGHGATLLSLTLQVAILSISKYTLSYSCLILPEIPTSRLFSCSQEMPVSLGKELQLRK